MEKAQQISRRTWLAQVALGSFAVWSELNFGFGRRGWGVALGGRDLAVGVAHAQNLAPAETLRVNLGAVKCLRADPRQGSGGCRHRHAEQRP